MRSVLIVDDDTSIRTHLAAYVRELGHDAELAADAMEALATVDGRAFDVVLSDVRMAGMDGLALLRELRRRHPETGVVLMTAYATVPDAVEAIRSGAYDYLVKPFSLEQLINALERAVVLARGDAIGAEDLPDQVLAPAAGLPAPSIATVPGSLEDLERAHVQRVLAESATLEEAATRLGINSTTLWRKRKRWGLDQ